jgi:hypothetical protein
MLFLNLMVARRSFKRSESPAGRWTEGGRGDTALDVDSVLKKFLQN